MNDLGLPACFHRARTSLRLEQALEFLQALDGVDIGYKKFSTAGAETYDATNDARRLYIILHMIPREVARETFWRLDVPVPTPLCGSAIYSNMHLLAPNAALLTTLREVLEEVSV